MKPMYRVTLRSCGNPDHGQAPESDLPGVPDVGIEVESIDQAQQECMDYIRTYDLGASNWAGGRITTLKGRYVSNVAYNGRVYKSA